MSAGSQPPAIIMQSAQACATLRWRYPPLGVTR
jgi:hypothetical protein